MAVYGISDTHFGHTNILKYRPQFSSIEELLSTVSKGDIDHPVFGKRWSGDMDEEEFLMEVDDYILALQDEVEALKSHSEDNKSIDGMIEWIKRGSGRPDVDTGREILFWIEQYLGRNTL